VGLDCVEFEEPKSQLMTLIGLAYNILIGHITPHHSKGFDAPLIMFSMVTSLSSARTICSNTFNETVSPSI
jgi:hypothetical protein